MQFLYLLALSTSIAGMAVIDYKWRLAFWHDRRATSLSLLIGVAVFIVWDLLGIGLGIFFHGDSRFSLPLRLLPEFPLEEIFFLVLLCYCTLVIYRWAVTRW